jgi:nardilysin
LPSPNQFLTEDFTILDKEENHPDYPEKVFSSELIEIWYRKDEQYKLPDAFYGLYLINPLIVKTAKMKAMVDFYVTLLELQLNEEVFPAKMALFSCGISNGDKGITLSLSGYNQKLHLLSELIAKYIVDFKSNLREEMFTAVKEKLIEYFYNRLRDPDCLADDVRLSLIVNNYHSLVDKYNIVCSITMDSMKKFSEEFISTLYVKALVQGNVTREHAINVVKNFVSTINCKPISSSSYPKVSLLSCSLKILSVVICIKFRVCQIPKGETFCVMESFNTRDSNSIIINYYQCGTYTIKGRVIIEIVMLIIEEPLFDTLRTKEQLGYSVSCSERDTTGILGFSITVNAQATKHSTEYVDGRIEEFIKQMSQLLANMSPEAFERTKQDLIKTKRCADTHLGEEFYRNWFEIYDEDYTFDRVTQDIKELEQLVIGDVQTWWETHTLHGNKENFRKLSVQVVGSRSSQGNAEKREICDEDENKNSKLTLKFLNYDDNDKKCEDERRCMINSVAGFKDNLFLYPLVCNYTIKN